MWKDAAVSAALRVQELNEYMNKYKYQHMICFCVCVFIIKVGINTMTVFATVRTKKLRVSNYLKQHFMFFGNRLIF